MRDWSFEPIVVFSLLFSAILFAVGLCRLWRESPKRKASKARSAVYFAGGWIALFVSLVSPVHAWGRVLFSAHMTQHEILMLVAAPLFVLSEPLVPIIWALPLKWSRRIGNVGRIPVIRRAWRWVTIPLVAWIIHAVALWVWHIPVLFEAVLRSELVHTAQHLSFLISALLFWWALIYGARGVAGYGAAVLYVFTTSLHSGLLGALLTFARTVWYPSYVGLTETWDLTPLEDQQLGGLIMWIPAGLVYVFAGLLLFQRWLHESEHRTMELERVTSARVQSTEVS
jgi:cytochrome c oxidase assembly factor CtaG